MYSLDLKLTTVCSIRASPPLPSYLSVALGLPLENKDKAEAFSSLFLFSLFPLLSPTFWPKRQHGKNASGGDVFVLAPNFTFLAHPRGRVFTFLAGAKNVKTREAPGRRARSAPHYPCPHYHDRHDSGEGWTKQKRCSSETVYDCQPPIRTSAV